MSAGTHARPARFYRLRSLFRSHGDLPEAPALDLQDDGDHADFTDGLDVADAVKSAGDGGDPFGNYDADSVWQRALRDRPREVAHEPAEREPWWGLTELDFPPQMARQYVPEPEPEPAPPVFRIAADYRALPVFRAVVRAACAVGLTGIGTRGVHPVIPVPDYGLDRFTADIPDDGIGQEFDRIEQEAEAGFVRARRVFHSADSGAFPAITRPALPDYRVAERMTANALPGGPSL
jgi:hypothetical protein